MSRLVASLTTDSSKSADSAPGDLDPGFSSPARLPAEPGLLDAAWRFRWLVASCVLVAVVVTLGYGASRKASYVATSSLLLEDPKAKTPFRQEPSQQAISPDRYVADQVQLLRTAEIAERAAEIGREQLPGQWQANRVASQFSVATTKDSNLVRVRFRAPSRRRAQVGANAVAVAYQDVFRRRTAERADATTARINASIEAIDQDRRRLIEQLAAQGGANPVLTAQFREALDRLAAVSAARAGAADAQSITNNDTELAALNRLVTGLETLAELDVARAPQLQGLIRELRVNADVRATLVQERAQVRAAAAVSSSGVSLFSAAGLPPPQAPARKIRTVLGAGTFGLLVGIGLAYLLALRRPTLTNSDALAVLLGAPVLGRVPNFRDEKLATLLPVADAPGSASAASMRFAAIALDVSRGGRDGRAIVLVGARAGAGTTVVTANLALALAAQGRRVLAVDGDPASRALSKLLLGGPKTPGAARAPTEGSGLFDVLNDIDLGDTAGSLKLRLLGGGGLSSPGLPGPGAKQRFVSNPTDYDIILVDAPALLEAPASSDMARAADAVITVVPHDSPLRLVNALKERFTLLNVAIHGGIYTRAPLRSLPEGSEVGAGFGQGNGSASADTSSSRRARRSKRAAATT